MLVIKIQQPEKRHPTKQEQIGKNKLKNMRYAYNQKVFLFNVIILPRLWPLVLVQGVTKRLGQIIEYEGIYDVEHHLAKINCPILLNTISIKVPSILTRHAVKPTWM